MNMAAISLSRNGRWAERTVSECMISGNDETPDGTQVRKYRGCWFNPVRCSICTSSIWLTPISLKEPAEAPEPQREWILCQTCHEALLVELGRSSINLSVRLRVAMGLVAAERSPHAYTTGTHAREQEEFQREFMWGIRLMVIFALLHLIIFAIVLAVPR